MPIHGMFLPRWAGLLIATALGTCIAAGAFAEERVAIPRVGSQEAAFRVVRAADGLEHPWAKAFLPDGRILVTERPGRLTMLVGEERVQAAGLPEVSATGQGGLLDVVLHPDYEENGWIYPSYSAGRGEQLGTRVARARLSDAGTAGVGTAPVRLTDLQTIYVMEPGSASGIHFGSRLAFAPDGTLLVTLGERGERGRAQDLAGPGGSVLRLNDDGSIPPDNPFAGRAGARQGNLFVGALAGQHLRRLVVEDGRVVHREVLLPGKLGRLRDVRQGPDGNLWLLTDEPNGALYRLEPVGG